MNLSQQLRLALGNCRNCARDIPGDCGVSKQFR